MDKLPLVRGTNFTPYDLYTCISPFPAPLRDSLIIAVPGQSLSSPKNYREPMRMVRWGGGSSGLSRYWTALIHNHKTTKSSKVAPGTLLYCFKTYLAISIQSMPFSWWVRITLYWWYPLILTSASCHCSPWSPLLIHSRAGKSPLPSSCW